MNPNFELAILEFIANEFHLDTANLSLDTNFKIDLNLNPEGITDLLQRLQDALNFIIPDEKIANIETVGDIIAAITPEKDPLSSEDTFI